MREEGRRGGTGNWPRTIRRIEEEEVSDRFGPRWSWTGCVNFPKIWHEELLPTTSNFLYSLCFPGLPLCADTNSHKSGGIKWRRRGGGLTPRARNVFLGREKSNFFGERSDCAKSTQRFVGLLAFSALLFLTSLCFCPSFFHCRCEKSGFQEEKIMGFVWDGGRLLPSPLPSYQEERVQEGTKSRLTPKTELGLLGLASRDGKQHRSPWFLPSPLSLFFFT